MSPITTIQEVDFSKSEQYTLSIRISTDGFSFSIFNPLANQPYTFFNIPIDKKLPIVSNLKKMVATNPFLSQLYKKVNIVIGDTKTNLVPLKLFHPDITQELYFYGQRLLNTNIQISYNKLEQSGLAVIFGINKTLYNFLTGHFRNPHFMSQDTCLLAYFMQKSREGNTKKMFVHIQADTMKIFCLNKGKLLLTNAFNTCEISNQIYYILYIWKEMSFSQERDELFISGIMNTNEKRQLLESIKRFIQTVTLLDTPEYLDLKAINLCEL